jgi:hypothetical protein
VNAQGLPHGRGVQDFGDGRKQYDGEWVNGHKEGRAVLEWRNRDRYEGEWRHGSLNGEGTLVDRVGKVLFRGRWVYGAPMEEEV